MSVPDGEDDEAFLLAVDAVEAAALDSSSKRRRLSTSSSSPTPATPPDASASASEGSYLAVLKGSHSSAWKQQQVLTYAHKLPDGFKTLAAGAGGTQVASGACFRCGDPGHWARECPQSAPSVRGGGGIGGGGYADAGGVVEEKACPCGAGNCLVLTSNKPRNPGRKFYKCPMRGSGSRGFFEWCDDQQPRVGAPPQASPQYQTDFMTSSQNSSKRSSSSCFKCGQENHWAKDCPNQSSDPYPDKGGRTIASAASPDACFKCGKAGHWSRDCPALNSGGGTGASLVRSCSTLGSWNSRRY